jgi:hypothetical protein
MIMTTSSQKIRRLRAMKPYLSELTALAGHSVCEEDLGSLEQVAVLQNEAQKFRTQMVPSFEIPFSERVTRRFTEFISKLRQANPSPVYVWTPRTNDCGAFLISSIEKINFAFDFSINTEGILAFLTKDLIDRLVLDFEISPTRATVDDGESSRRELDQSGLLSPQLP